MTDLFSSDSDGEEHDRSRSPARLALQGRIACIANIYGLIENHLPMHMALDRVGTLFEYTVDQCKKLLTRLADPILVQVGITHNPFTEDSRVFQGGVSSNALGGPERICYDHRVR